jgi:hypothetical protein
MPWSVDNIYQYTRFLTNKNQAGGISATDLFNAWNAEQSQYHQDLVGRWQKQNNTKTGIMSGLIEDEVTISALSPFILPLTSQPIAGGIAFKPMDYIYGVALRINGTKVFSVSHDMIWAVNDDVIDPPSIPDNSYYYTEYLSYFSFLPDAVTLYDLDYVAETTDIVWGFTLDANNRQVYNPAPGASVQPKWNKNTTIEITKRTLKGFGLHFDSREFENFGESNIQTGN